MSLLRERSVPRQSIGRNQSGTAAQHGASPVPLPSVRGSPRGPLLPAISNVRHTALVFVFNAIRGRSSRVLAATIASAFGITTAAAARTPCAVRPLALGMSAPLLGDVVKIGCPLRESSQHVRLSIQVKKFCIVATPFHSQLEFKIKPSIKNLGSSTIDIRAPHLRLLVSRFNPSRWHPPAHGGSVGKPARVSYRGYSVWGIPANVNGSYDVDVNTAYASFASFWDGADLAPGETYFKPANRQGDLAYYVPRRYVTLDRNLIGFAYVSGGRARVVALYHNWHGRRPADDF